MKRKSFREKLKSLFSLRTEITIQIIDKDFNYHNADPIIVEGSVLADEQGKIVDIGNSQGSSIDLKWLSKLSISVGDKIRKQLLMDKNGRDFCILLTKPKKEEIST